MVNIGNLEASCLKFSDSGICFVATKKEIKNVRRYKQLWLCMLPWGRH